MYLSLSANGYLVKCTQLNSAHLFSKIFQNDKRIKCK